VRRRLPLPVALLLALSWAGCATVAIAPPQSVLDARAALGAAKQASADLLAKDEYDHAQRLLAQAESAFGSEQSMTRVDDLAFEARAEAQVAEARARSRTADEEYARLQQAIIAQQSVLLALKEKDRRLQEAVAAAKAQATGRAEAETRAAQAQAARDAEERRRREAEREAEMLRRAQQIKQAEAKVDARGLVIALSGRILFDSGSSKLQANAGSTLDQVAALLKDYPEYHVRIEGHTDNTGDLLLNNTLSQARAESVLTTLTQRGIPFDNLTAVGLGPTRPIASNATSAGRQLNRRVEIVLGKPIPVAVQP
jgi:outer membrane protein OmpA-like peptidoglycan-associated protein